MEDKDVKYIYAHNFSGFDGIFLLRHLLNYDGGEIKPLIFNGKLMAINFKFTDPSSVDNTENNTENKDNKNKTKARTLVFKDSFLLLPLSLRKLCKAFNVSTVKTHFPFLLTDINYSGKFPAFDLYTDLSKQEYFDIKYDFNDQTWSFREEAIKYCGIDCKALFEVLISFNNLIFNQFKLNIHSSFTLPSLAMKIYKTPPKKLVRIISNS